MNHWMNLSKYLNIVYTSVMSCSQCCYSHNDAHENVTRKAHTTSLSIILERNGKIPQLYNNDTMKVIHELPHI